MNHKQRIAIELAEDFAKMANPKGIISAPEQAVRDVRFFEGGWVAGRLRGIADGLKAAGIANADLEALGEAFIQIRPDGLVEVIEPERVAIKKGRD
jgi:hypothetical protein